MDSLTGMSEARALEAATIKAGWGLDSQVMVLLAYIEAQGDPETFADYLTWQVEQECAPSLVEQYVDDVALMDAAQGPSDDDDEPDDLAVARQVARDLDMLMGAVYPGRR